MKKVIVETSARHIHLSREAVDALYGAGYELTKKYVDVRWIMTGKGMRYNVRGPAKRIKAHFLMPEGMACKKLLVNGAETKFMEVAVDASRYVDCDVDVSGEVDFEIVF